MKSSLYHIGRWVVRAFLFVFTRFEVRGKENVPAKGACWFRPITQSDDPPVVGVSLGRSTIFMAKEELFRSRLSSYFVSSSERSRS